MYQLIISINVLTGGLWRKTEVWARKLTTEREQEKEAEQEKINKLEDELKVSNEKIEELTEDNVGSFLNWKYTSDYERKSVLGSTKIKFYFQKKIQQYEEQIQQLKDEMERNKATTQDVDHKSVIYFLFRNMTFMIG